MFPLAVNPNILSNPLAIFLFGIVSTILLLWYLVSDKERRKRNIGSILAVLLCGVCTMPFILNPIKKALRGGIDIVGGSSFTLSIHKNKDENGADIPLSPEAREKAMLIVEKRLDASGGQNVSVTGQGEDRLIVQVPGVDEAGAKKIRENLEKTAKLEVFLVHPESEQLIASGKTKIAGHRLYTQKNKNPDGTDAPDKSYILSRRIVIDGADVKFAGASLSNFGHVDIRLNSEGGKKMTATTSKMVVGRDLMATVLDGEVINVATVQSILGTDFSISGLDSEKECRDLASALMNPLQNPLKMEEERSISASLGEATVKQGLFAGLIGLILTVVMVFAYYRFAGLIAVIGILVNVLFSFGMMALFNFTFTLPGIAGIILSIGIAVDANVLVYERLREELEAGKSLKNAIQLAYDKAFSAIFDANLTTLLTAIILFWKSSGTIKGFATTLVMGIISSMFAAIVVTRVLFWWASDTGIMKNLSFMNLIPKKSYKFLSKARPALIFSAVLCLISIGAGVWKKEKSLGVDFTGGTILTFQLGNAGHVSAPDVDAALAGLALTKAHTALEEKSQIAGFVLTVRCANPDVNLVESELRKDIPLLAKKTGENFDIQMTKEQVSPTLGTEFLKNSVIALALGLIAILIYVTIRFEFSFALGAFIALFHDVIITIGVIILCGRELSLLHIGAILTIAGYSINDTIVVFDRIREVLRYSGDSVKKIMDDAISDTLSRTILTSTTTLVSVIILAIFGGPSMFDFSITIIIGIIIGTYSSIFVASPIVYFWTKWRRTSLREQVIETETTKELLKNTAVEG